MSADNLKRIAEEIQRISTASVDVTEVQVRRVIDEFDTMSDQAGSEELLEILELQIDGLSISMEGIDNSDLRALLIAAKGPK